MEEQVREKREGEQDKSVSESESEVALPRLEHDDRRQHRGEEPPEATDRTLVGEQEVGEQTNNNSKLRVRKLRRSSMQ